MFDLRLPETLSFFVDNLLPRSPRMPSGGLEPGVYIRLRVLLAIYSDDEQRRVSRWVHFLFSRPSNYTQVFMAVSRTPQDDVPLESYTHQSFHDSCWRDDGFSGLRKLWGEMRDILKPDEFHGERVSEHVSLEKVSLVEVEVHRPSEHRYTARENWEVRSLSEHYPLRAS